MRAAKIASIIVAIAIAIDDDESSLALNRYGKVPLMPRNEILIGKLRSSAEGTPLEGYSGRAGRHAILLNLH